MGVEACIPVIPSADLKKSLRLWVDGLEFKMDTEMHAGGKLIFCMLHKGGLTFMLHRRARHSGQAGGLQRYSALLGAVGYSRDKRAPAAPGLQSVRARRQGLRPNRILPHRRRWLRAFLRRTDEKVEHPPLVRCRCASISTRLSSATPVR
jgi:hypothetical protein